MPIRLNKAKDKYRVPKRVQDVIPIQTIYDSGVFRLPGNKYSMSYSFTDINYTSEDEEAQEEMLKKYYSLLNSFDPYSTMKLTIYRHKLDRVAFEQDYLLPPKGDGMDGYRDDANTVMMTAANGRSAAVKDRFFTVSVNKKNMEEVDEYFSRIERDLNRHFGELGSDVHAMKVDERLRIFHDFFRAGEEAYYHFDIAEARKKGHSFKDYICPDTMEFKADYFKMGTRFGRVLFLKEYANFIKDRIVTELTSVCENMLLSLDVISIPTDEAIRDAENRLLGVETNITNWQRKQNANNNFSATPPYDLVQQQEAMKDFLDDLTTRDQKMMQCVLTIVHTADSKEQLDSDTESLLQAANKEAVQLGVLRFQQMDGLNTVLPIGLRRIDTFRTLTSESVAVFVPFNAHEVFQKDGIYFGQNPISRSMIFADRTALKNGNEFILGVPGGGKSMIAKWEIACKRLGSDADILIIDPEREYSKLVEAMGGTVIPISASSDAHINPMDMDRSYNDGKNPVILKSEFIMSICDMISDGAVGPAEKSIIDRCAASVYKSYIDNGYTGAPPTLQDFRFELLSQEEPMARELALRLELFTEGSLNTFAQETNVNTENSMICYDILDLGEQLRPVGMLIVLDSILNRISRNRAAGKRTFLFIDEIYLLFLHQYSSEFLFKLWKRVRKYGACCCGITQNVDDLLHSSTARTMLANSESVVMLNQFATDRVELADLFNLTGEEITHITNSTPGHGLLRIGESVVPFDLKIPSDTQLYKLMTTKPGEAL